MRNRPRTAASTAPTTKAGAVEVGKRAKLYTVPGKRPNRARSTRLRPTGSGRPQPNHTTKIATAVASHETSTPASGSGIPVACSPRISHG